MAFAVFVWVKLSTYNLDADRMLTDTFGYARVAEYGLNEAGFWSGERPFTIPLLYKALGHTSEIRSSPDLVHRVTQLQLGVSIAAWAVLAGSVAWMIEAKWIRATAFGLILAFAATLDISQWDRMLLSESISTSLFAVLIAGGLTGYQLWGTTRGPPRSKWIIVYLVGMTGVIVLFSFSRDPNAYLLIAGAILLATTTIIRRVWREPFRWIVLLLSFLMALTFVVQDQTMVLSKRWVGPFLNVFSSRILPVDEFVRFFKERGLPADAITQEMYLGRSVLLRQVKATQEGRRLKAWIEQEGRAVYLQFLLSRPVQTFGKPLLRARSIVNPDSSEYRLPNSPDPVWAKAISGVFFPRSLKNLILFIIVSTVILTLGRRRYGAEPLLFTALGLLVLAYPLAFLVWHGDSIELERHSYQVALQVRLAAWLLFISLLQQAAKLVTARGKNGSTSMDDRLREIESSN